MSEIWDILILHKFLKRKIPNFFMEETLSLEEIADKEEFILVDSSCQSLQGGRGFQEKENLLWETYHDKDYVTLDREVIEMNMVSTSRFNTFLRRKNVFTLSCVADELSEFEEGITTKIHHLNEKNESNKQRRIDLSYFRHSKGKRAHNLNDRANKMQGILKELQSEVWKSVKLARNNSLEIIDERYDPLFELTRAISIAADLKRKDVGGKREFRGKLEDKREFRKKLDPYESSVDEQITSAVLYYALFTDRFPALVTCDKDFISLLACVPNILGSDEFMPNNHGFRDRFKNRKPYRLYAPWNGQFRSVFEEDNRDFYEKVLFSYNASKENQFDLKERIRDYWMGNPLSEVQVKSDESYEPAVD